MGSPLTRAVGSKQELLWSHSTAYSVAMSCCFTGKGPLGLHHVWIPEQLCFSADLPGESSAGPA